jgi:hypothetical protein
VAGAWPALPLTEWQETRDTLHLWTQIVGKVRPALAPAVNHRWHVPLYVDARGLTTSLMPYGGLGLEILFDFGTHELASYDPDAVHRFWISLVSAHRVLSRFRGGFRGKSSPVHFFWGAFDLAVTRFSGRLPAASG